MLAKRFRPKKGLKREEETLIAVLVSSMRPRVSFPICTQVLPAVLYCSPRNISG